MVKEFREEAIDGGRDEDTALSLCPLEEGDAYVIIDGRDGVDISSWPSKRVRKDGTGYAWKLPLASKQSLRNIRCAHDNVYWLFQALNKETGAEVIEISGIALAVLDGVWKLIKYGLGGVIRIDALTNYRSYLPVALLPVSSECGWCVQTGIKAIQVATNEVCGKQLTHFLDDAMMTNGLRRLVGLVEIKDIKESKGNAAEKASTQDDGDVEPTSSDVEIEDKSSSDDEPEDEGKDNAQNDAVGWFLFGRCSTKVVKHHLHAYKKYLKDRSKFGKFLCYWSLAAKFPGEKWYKMGNHRALLP